MRPPFLRIVGAAALLLLGGSRSPSSAHDFWLEPSTFAPAPGGTVSIRLRVGEDLVGDVLPRDPSHIVAFRVASAGVTRDVPGTAGRDPAGAVPLDAPAVSWFAYQSRPRPVRIGAEKFERYLGEEGLETVSEWRAKHGEQKRPGKEIFSRCAKALVVSPGAASGEAPRFGCPLELTVALEGGRLETSLEYLGRPLEGALVAALHRGSSLVRLTERTDASGRATFDLPEPGVWLVKSVHMKRLEGDPRADWESFWSSVTLEASSRSVRVPPVASRDPGATLPPVPRR